MASPLPLPTMPSQPAGGFIYKPDMFAIVASFLMHSGSRHLSFDLTDAQKKILAHPFSKAIIMFAMFYISTRNIKWSIILSITYFLLINMLLNENHPLNIYSKSWLVSQGFIKNENFHSIQKTNYNWYYNNTAAME